MPRTGGRTPYDPSNALVGPARVLWAETTVTAPTQLADIVSQVADAQGEYPAQAGWNDFGLMTDAPSVSHGRETSALEYQQNAELFKVVSSVSRSFTATVGEIEPEILKLLENTTITEAIAASAAAAPKKNAAQTKIWTGLYAGLRQVRVAIIAYRPEGAGVVTEPGGATRPPAVARVIPICQLSGDDIESEFPAGEPVSAEITFDAVADPALGAKKEHGYWVIELPGAIAA